MWFKHGRKLNFEYTTYLQLLYEIGYYFRLMDAISLCDIIEVQ